MASPLFTSVLPCDILGDFPVSNKTLCLLLDDLQEAFLLKLSVPSQNGRSLCVASEVLPSFTDGVYLTATTPAASTLQGTCSLPVFSL